MMFPLTGRSHEALREQLREPLALLHGLSFIPAGSRKWKLTHGSLNRTRAEKMMADRALAVMGEENTAVVYFSDGAASGNICLPYRLEQLGPIHALQRVWFRT